MFAVLPDDVLAKDHVAITAGFVIGERAVLVIQSMLNGDIASHLIGLVRQITTNPIRFLVNTTYSIARKAVNVRSAYRDLQYMVSGAV